MKKILTWLSNPIPNFFGKIAEANKLTFMTDPELIQQINSDAEDGRINTCFSQEYDRRHRGAPVPLTSWLTGGIFRAKVCS